MVDKNNKSENPNTLLCRHNDSKTWRSACKNCLDENASWQKTIASLPKMECYLISSFARIKQIPKPTDILPLLEKIPKVIQKKFKGKAESKRAFFLPITREIIKDKDGKEKFKYKVKGDNFIFTYCNKSKNQYVSAPIIWKREEVLNFKKEDEIYYGIEYEIKKMPRLPKNRQGGATGSQPS